MGLKAFLNHPELKPGIAIQFKDKAGKTRTEIIFDRDGDILRVRNALRKKTSVNIKNVIGYWGRDVKTTMGNMIILKNKEGDEEKICLKPQKKESRGLRRA